MHRVVVAVVLAAACFAPPGGTQVPRWRDTLDHRLRNAAKSITDRGWTLTGSPQIDSLSDAETASLTFTLRGGIAYAVVAVCDTDCRDLDLVLTDPDGTEVDSDVERDDVPLVRVTPPETMRYRLKVVMARCGMNPCRYAIGVYGN